MTTETFIEEDDLPKERDPLTTTMDGIEVVQRQKISQEKLALSSTRAVLYKLMHEGTITATDKLIDVLRVIEEEFARIENI